MIGTQYMVTHGIIIPCYASGEQSWMTFGVEIPARFRTISGDLEEAISTPSRRSASKDQCLSLAPMKSGIQLAWDVRSRTWTLRGEKGSGRISYSGTGASDSHLVQQCMGSSNRLFEAGAIYSANDKNVCDSTAPTTSK